MEVLESEFQNILSSWKFVGAFEQSFDPGLDQIEITKIYFAVCKPLDPQPIFLREFK